MKARSAPDRAYAWSGALLFALIVGALKILQARRLQNQAFDLGIYANVAWNTAHGFWFRDSIKGVNFLGDHFSPGLFAVLAPLMRLWPDAAVLSAAQSAALALGIPAVHRLAWDKTRDRSAALGFAALYALSPLVHETSRYDVHAVAFAVPLLLWGLALPGRAGRAALTAAGAFQEDLWLCAAAASWRRRERRAAAALGAFVVSVAAIRLIGRGFTPPHWSFYDPARVAASLATPDRFYGLMRLMIPLGLLPVLAGTDALPLLVPLGYTWLGANPHQGRLDLQYGAPLIAFAFLAAIAGWSRLERRPAWLLPLLCAVSLLWLKPYSRPLPPEKAAAARDLLALVPPDAPVCASFDLVPRLAARRDICLWTPGREPADRWLALDATPFAFGPGALQNASAVEAAAVAHPERVAYSAEGFVLLKPAESFSRMAP